MVGFAVALVAAGCGTTQPHSASTGPTSPTSSSAATGGSSGGGTGSATTGGSASTAACLSSATPPAPGTSHPAMVAVQFVGASRGWVVGATAIRATTDGGASWQDQLTGNLALGQVDFVSSSTGWAVGTDRLLGTTDAGRCWQVLGEPVAGSLRQVHFVSSTLGWGVAGGNGGAIPTSSPVPVAPRAGGILVRTTDGGLHWREVAGVPASVQSTCFVNATTGWLAASGEVYRTTDGGSRWQRVLDTSAGSNLLPGQPALVTLGCGSPADVWAVAASGGAAAGNSPWATFASTDGTRFHLVTQDMFATPSSGQAPSPGSYPGVASVIGNGVAAVAGFTPALPPPMAGVTVLSATGHVLSGVSHPTGMAAPSGIAFVSPTTGWVVGSVVPTSSASSGGETEIAATTDGGATWSVQKTSP